MCYSEVQWLLSLNKDLNFTIKRVWVISLIHIFNLQYHAEYNDCTTEHCAFSDFFTKKYHNYRSSMISDNQMIMKYQNQMMRNYNFDTFVKSMSKRINFIQRYVSGNYHISN
ncbi:MAG TPA: hypothetical protein PL063_08785 [Candidatus Cloacimonadota bacterium]|nr:hypothetical protein [Candidatus Cloacimonadales bacterium]HPY97296.1 hypothetical protein [Candidatus Cloacimonadota bacterium]HQB41817.1 hypothetical protein [Candidatus Cloacimonadota bacterium]